MAFNDDAIARCTTRDLPADVNFRSRVSYQYLPVLETTEERIDEVLSNLSDAMKANSPMVRTGHKSPEAALYASQLTAMPSSYAVRVGNYLFDGVSPDGSLMVTFAPGYAEHIRGGEFDPDWEGTELLKSQMQSQVDAAQGRQIVYWAAEEDTSDALAALADEAGHDDDTLTIRQQDPNEEAAP